MPLWTCDGPSTGSGTDRLTHSRNSLPRLHLTAIHHRSWSHGDLAVASPVARIADKADAVSKTIDGGQGRRIYRDTGDYMSDKKQWRTTYDVVKSKHRTADSRDVE